MSVKGKRVKQLIENQRAELSTISEGLQSSVNQKTEDRSDIAHLKFECQRVYKEIEVLTRKKATEPVTPRMTTRVNELIEDVRKIGDDDKFVRRIKRFVAAGNEPESCFQHNRDIIFPLSSW